MTLLPVTFDDPVLSSALGQGSVAARGLLPISGTSGCFAFNPRSFMKYSTSSRIALGATHAAARRRLRPTRLPRVEPTKDLVRGDGAPRGLAGSIWEISALT